MSWVFSLEEAKSRTSPLRAPLCATGACVMRAPLGPSWMERCPHPVTAGHQGGADHCEAPLLPPPPSRWRLPYPALPISPEFVLHAQVLTTIMMCTAMQEYLRGCEEIRALATLLRANSLRIKKRCSAASLWGPECLICRWRSGWIGSGSEALTKYHQRALISVPPWVKKEVPVRVPCFDKPYQSYE